MKENWEIDLLNCSDEMNAFHNYLSLKYAYKPIYDKGTSNKNIDLNIILLVWIQGVKWDNLIVNYLECGFFLQT